MSQEPNIPKAEAIVGRWICFRWRHSVSVTFGVREAWCQAVRGGAVAELSGGFFVSKHPTLLPLAEMDLLLVQTNDERAADMARREPLRGDPMAFAKTGAPVGPQPIRWPRPGCDPPAA